MIALPDDFKYPIAAIVGTHVLLVWQVVQVEHTRIAAGIAYPQLYAEKEEAARSKQAMIFNCVQRAHQNMLENVPILYSSTLIASLKYPIVAASLLTAYTLTRIPYTLGYRTGDANKRNALGPWKVGVPIIASLAEFSLLFLSGWVALKLFID